MIDTIKQYAKFIAAVLGAFVTAFSTLIPADWGPWLTAAAAFITAISVLAIPNGLTNKQLEDIARHRFEAGE